MTDTTKLSTAECYGIALCELGEEHKDVVALTADLAKKLELSGTHSSLPVGALVKLAVTCNNIIHIVYAVYSACKSKANCKRNSVTMSAMDAMTILYHRFMKLDVNNPDMEDRDRFVLSKGHDGSPEQR